MFVSCANDTQMEQTPLLNNDIILETVASEPKNSLTSEPYATQTPEPIISEPDNTPTIEPVISKPDNTPTIEPVISEPDNTPIIESVVSTPNNPTPTPNVVASPIFNWTTIKTKEEFHNMVSVANGVRDTENVYAFSDINDMDFERLTGLTLYYDFANLVEDVVLNEIRVKQVYVVVEYRDKEGIETDRMVLDTTRGGGNVDVEQFLEGYRRSMGPTAQEVIINGNRALKEEIFGHVLAS